MSNIPVTFQQLKSRMNSNVLFALEQMNEALEKACRDPEYSIKEKFRMTQEYLALFIRLENEIMKQEDHRETMKHRRLNTKIKQHEVDQIEDEEKSTVNGGYENQTGFSDSFS